MIKLTDVLMQIDLLLSEIEKTSDGTFVRDVYNPAIKQYIKEYKEVNDILDNADKIWLGSDWHIWKKGNFKNYNARSLIYNQKKFVKPNDAFIFLGDIVHRDTFEPDIQQKLKTIISGLAGQKIMVLGNHDIFDKQFYYDCGFEHVNEGFIWRNFVFSHVPLHFSAFGDAEYNIHGHTHGWNGDRKVPYKNHICVYSESYNNMPITLEQIMIRFQRYRR